MSNLVEELIGPYDRIEELRDKVVELEQRWAILESVYPLISARIAKQVTKALGKENE